MLETSPQEGAEKGRWSGRGRYLGDATAGIDFTKEFVNRFSSTETRSQHGTRNSDRLAQCAGGLVPPRGYWRLGPTAVGCYGQGRE